MNPLSQSHLILKLLCVCPDNTKNRLTKNIPFSMVFLFLLITGNLAGIGYIVKYVKTDLENALFAGLQITAGFGLAYTMIAAHIQRGGI